MSVCCAIKCVFLPIVLCLHGTAWLVSPSYRAKVREHEENEARQQEELARDCDSLSKKIKDMNNQMDEKRAKAKSVLESDEKLRENVKMMMNAGCDEYLATRKCYIEKNKERILKRTNELNASGIPGEESYRIAVREIVGF